MRQVVNQILRTRQTKPTFLNACFIMKESSEETITNIYRNGIPVQYNLDFKPRVKFAFMFTWLKIVIVVSLYY